MCTDQWPQVSLTLDQKIKNQNQLGPGTDLVEKAKMKASQKQPFSVALETSVTNSAAETSFVWTKQLKETTKVHVVK